MCCVARRRILVLSIFAGMMLCAAFARAHTGVLNVRFDTGPELPVDEVCIVDHPNLILPPGLRQQSATSSNVWVVCGKDRAADTHGRKLELNVVAQDGKVTINGVSLSNNRLEIRYTSTPAPEILTVASVRGNTLFHDAEAKTWVRTMGAAPVSLEVVPRKVSREVVLPEYSCLAGQPQKAFAMLDIDSHWRTNREFETSACAAVKKQNRGADKTRFKVPAGTRVDSGHPVVGAFYGFTFAWKRHKLFECLRRKDQRAEATKPDLAFTSNVKLECRPPTYDKATDRYEWWCPEMEALPAQLRLTASCDLRGERATWSASLRHPGQVLSSYVEPRDRSVLVKWEGWCEKRPGLRCGSNRKDLEADRIFGVEVIDSNGHAYELVLPSRPGAYTVERQSLPHVQHGQRVKLRIRGDRAFDDMHAVIGTCDLKESENDAEFCAGNCLVIEPPPESKRRDLDTLGARFGLGVSAVEPSKFDSIVSLDDEKDDFFSPLGEVGLHVLWRGDDEGLSRHLDLELAAVLAVQRWNGFSQTVLDDETLESRESAPLLLAALEPGVRTTALYQWSIGAFLVGGWAGPALRERVLSTPDQSIWGAGLSAGYSWSSTTALEFRPRVMVAHVRITAYDAAGIVESRYRHPVLLLQFPLVLRFDDIVGD